MEVEGLNAVVDGVVHAFLDELCVCVGIEYGVEGEVEVVDGGRGVAVGEEVGDKAEEAGREGFGVFVIFYRDAAVGGGAAEVEADAGEGAPEVFPSLGENGCFNGFVNVDKGEDVLKNFIWELADSVFLHCFR